MTEPADEFEKAVSLQAMLGYLNFSEGKPDPRFQKQWSDAYSVLHSQDDPQPWQTLHRRLRDKLNELKTAGVSGPFRDPAQAEAVLDLVFTQVLAAYRAHHADLLYHQSEADLFQPYFLAKV